MVVLPVRPDVFPTFTLAHAPVLPLKLTILP